jgi:hypothetical protein
MYPQISTYDEYRNILQDYGWHEDASAGVWFPPDGLYSITGIRIAKRQGFWCWATLDFESKECVEVDPGSLEDYLASRQPDVDRPRK